MADREAARKTSEAYVVSTTPDVCKTPMGSKDVPVPYSIVGSFFESILTAVGVFFTKLAAFFLGSRIERVEGNEAGTSGGVVSGVNRGGVRPTAGSSTVHVNKQPAIRHDDPAEMNTAGPEGKGNTKGKVVYIKARPKVKVAPSGEIAGDAISLPPLDTERGLMARLLLAEVGSVSKYGEAAVLTGMQAVKATVMNRLQHPSQFMASGATVKEIITAPGQYAGFSQSASGAVSIDPSITSNIDKTLALAEKGNPDAIRQVQTALDVTDAPTVDPFDPTGTNPTVGVRTLNSGSPGAGFEEVEDGDVAGQSFYRLSPDKKKKKAGKGTDGIKVVK